MDFFHDINEIRDSFKKFAHKLPEDGLLVLNGEIDDISYIVEGSKPSMCYALITMNLPIRLKIFPMTLWAMDTLTCTKKELL